MRPLIAFFLTLPAIYFCYYLYYQFSSYSLLWIGVFLSFLFMIYGVIKGKSPIEKLMTVIVFLISMRMLLLMRYTWGFSIATDSAFNLQLSNLIKDKEAFFFGMGFEREAYYSLHPGLNLFSAILSKISGLDLFFISGFFFPVLSGSLFLIFYYLLARSILTDINAVWACVIVCMAPTMIFFESGFIQEAFALIFLVASLYIVFGICFEKLRGGRYILLLLLFVFVVAASHHWTSYNLLIAVIATQYLPILWSKATQFFLRRPSAYKRITLLLTMSIFIIIFTWLSFISYGTFVAQLAETGEFFSQVIAQSEHTAPSIYGYSWQERLAVYLGQIVLFGFGGFELIKSLLKKRKNAEELLVEFWFVFSFFYIFSLTFLLPKGYTWQGISQRSWIFAFIAMSPLIAKSVSQLNNSKEQGQPRFSFGRLLRVLLNSKSLLLVFPLVSVILLAPGVVHYPNLPMHDNSYYTTATWVRQYLRNGTIATDPYSWCVLVPYGRVSYYGESSPYVLDTTAFVTFVYNSENFSQVVQKGWKTIVFNKQINNVALYSGHPIVSTNSHLFDGYYNRIHDSNSLIMYDDPRVLING